MPTNRVFNLLIKAVKTYLLKDVHLMIQDLQSKVVDTNLQK